MMRFELEYTDNKHHVHRKSLKKIVGLLELDITKKEQIEIQQSKSGKIREF